MTKVSKTHVLNQDNSGRIEVGYSNTPYLTAKIFYKEFMNFEGLVSLRTCNTFQNNTQPPKREKKITTKRLSQRSISIIKRTCRMYRALARKNKRRGICSMITLTYPFQFPNDMASKKHLDNFIKRIKRQFPAFMYVWVAEKQDRGAIHYHILTPNYIPKELINEAWSEIVEKWCIKEGFEFKLVLPNVIGVKKADVYISNYLKKDKNEIQGNRYNLSTNSRELIKPVEQKIYCADPHYLVQNVRSLLNASKVNFLEIQKTEPKTDKKYTVGFWLRHSKSFPELLAKYFDLLIVTPLEEIPDEL